MGAGALTTEILYCARCRRVIRPREISEGRYHFVDGDAVCAECFIRLSRRLRPVSGIHDAPKPVDLSTIEGPPGEVQPDAPESAAVAVVAGAKPEAARAAGPAGKPASVRRQAASRRPLQAAVVVACFIAGLLLGGAAWLMGLGRGEAGAKKPANPPATPASPGAPEQTPPVQPKPAVDPPAPAPVEKPVENPVEKPVEKPAEPTTAPAGSKPPETAPPPAEGKKEPAPGAGNVAPAEGAGK